MHLFSSCYSDSHLKSITDIQEIGSGRRENNFMCQEQPSFCFSVTQVYLSVLAFYAYRHWAIPRLVCDWAFPESGWIFAYWEPGLIPLNKICGRRTFLSKIKWAKKKKQVYWFMSHYLKLYKAMNPAELHFILLCQCEILCIAWVYHYYFYYGRNKCAFLSFCMFWYIVMFFVVFDNKIRPWKVFEILEGK